MEQGAKRKERVWSFVSLLYHLIKHGTTNSSLYLEQDRLASVSAREVRTSSQSWNVRSQRTVIKALVYWKTQSISGFALCHVFSRVVCKVGQKPQVGVERSRAPSTQLGPIPCYLGWPLLQWLIGTELKVISIPASYHFDLLPALNFSSSFALDLLFPYLPSACDILWHFHHCTTP